MDPLQASEALIGWAEQHQRKAEAYRGLHRQMSQLSVTETSTDGMVRVSVDGQGVPTELTLTDRARGADPAQIVASYRDRFSERVRKPPPRSAEAAG